VCIFNAAVFFLWQYVRSIGLFARTMRSLSVECPTVHGLHQQYMYCGLRTTAKRPPQTSTKYCEHIPIIMKFNDVPVTAREGLLFWSMRTTKSNYVINACILVTLSYRLCLRVWPMSPNRHSVGQRARQFSSQYRHGVCVLSGLMRVVC